MIVPKIEQHPLGDLRLLPDGRNARYMHRDQFYRLVENIRNDGCLTSVPLIHREKDGTLRVLSGNHRVEAAVEALGADTVVDVMVVEDLDNARALAIQLSHNAIAGQDDLGTLAQLYAELEDVDWKAYSGLDDRTLALLEEVDLTPIAEPNLDYQTLSIMFLPLELERARASMAEAAQLVKGADETWLAAYPEHERMLMAMQTAGMAHAVTSIGIQLGIVLDVFDRHVIDLADGFVRPDGTLRKDFIGDYVPILPIFGVDAVPKDVGVLLENVVRRLVDEGDVLVTQRWRALEYVFADYLAGIGGPVAPRPTRSERKKTRKDDEGDG